MSGSPPVEGFAIVSRTPQILRQQRLRAEVEAVLEDIQRLFQVQYDEEEFVADGEGSSSKVLEEAFL